MKRCKKFEVTFSIAHESYNGYTHKDGKRSKTCIILETQENKMFWKTKESKAKLDLNKAYVIYADPNCPFEREPSAVAIALEEKKDNRGDSWVRYCFAVIEKEKGGHLVKPITPNDSTTRTKSFLRTWVREEKYDDYDIVTYEEYNAIK